MSSGQKQLVTNTRERAVSTDLNRSEAFIAQDRSQIARFQYNDQRLNYYSNSGVTKQNVGTEVPMAADVYGGLMVDPQATSLLITPGEIGCLFPDPGITADDSPYMLINDPGQQTAGVLTFTANGGGGPRVDLVECQPVSTILETDNRDIFNPATGLFAPSPVTKVQAFRLQYRIRLGTPAAGCPAPVAAWVPLAAIVTGTAAADFNGCDFYDVRPLVEDRVQPQSPGGLSVSVNYPLTNAEWSTTLDTGIWRLGGFALSEYGGYLAGGQLRRATPSFTGVRGGTGNADGDPLFINLSNPENQGTGFTHGSNHYNSLCAMFPAGLPRWVRYSQTAIGGGFGRVPRGPRGVVVITQGDTGLSNGQAIRTIPVFGACNGVILGVVKSDIAGSNFTSTNAQGKWIYTNEPATIASFDHNDVSGVARIKFVGSTNYPAAAKELRIELRITYKDPSAPNTDRVNFELQDAAGVIVQKLPSQPYYNLDATATVTVSHDLVVPIPGRSLFDDVNLVTSFLKVTSPGIMTAWNASAVLVGWRL